MPVRPLRGCDDAQHLIDLCLQRGAIALLRVLQHEDHKKGDEARHVFGDKLPALAPAEQWAAAQPHEHIQAREQKCGGPAENGRCPVRDGVECARKVHGALPCFSTESRPGRGTFAAAPACYHRDAFEKGTRLAQVPCPGANAIGSPAAIARLCRLRGAMPCRKTAAMGLRALRAAKINRPTNPARNGRSLLAAAGRTSGAKIDAAPPIHS